MMELQELQKLWTDWSKGFLKSKTLPMSDSISRVFMSAVMMELSGKGVPEDLLTEFKNTFAYKVLDKRAEFAGLEISEPAKMFLCVLSDSPGTLVMFVYALRYWQLEHAGEQVTVNNIAHTFPMGFPTESALSSAWDSQKLRLEDRTVNLLDGLSAESLQSIAVSV